MFSHYETFDIAVALYYWLQHNWDGQTDPKYKSFCILTKPGMFNPGPLMNFETINEDTQEIYNLLTDDNYNEALNIILHFPE